MIGTEFASIASLLRDKGTMTKEASHLLASAAATWAGVKITLECAGGQAIVAGAEDAAVRVVLCARSVAEFEHFDIMSQNGLVAVPPLAPLDPVCSTSLLRAISGAVSLVDFDFACTVFQEQGRGFTMPLVMGAKPYALSIAQSIWSSVAKQVPQVGLADHTDKDSMGTMNLGTMFKVVSLLLAQGAICKYILYMIHEFQFVFLSGQNVVYVGSGIGKTAWLLSTLAQLDLKMFAFERYVPNHDVSAETLMCVRNNNKVHNLKVASL